MKSLKAVAVVFVLLLAAAAGREALAQPFELDVSASPVRQQVLYPFGARIYVTVTDAATGAPIDRAKVQLAYSATTNNGREIGGAYYQRTKKNGTARFRFTTGPGTELVGHTVSFVIRADKKGLQGITEATVDVISE